MMAGFIKVKNHLINLENVANFELMGVQITYNTKGGYSYFISCDSEEEAEQIFNNILKQNGST